MAPHLIQLIQPSTIPNQPSVSSYALPYLLFASFNLSSSWMPSIVCTGFDVTEALRNYLTIGHNIDVDKDHRAPLVPPDELLNEPDSKYDPRLAELERETSILEDCQRYFRKIRAGAPAEDRKVLEIPYCEYNLPCRNFR